MEIYAIFNSDTNVYQCALIKGQDYQEKGDKQWKERMSERNNIFGSPHTEGDWILIDEEDFQKYVLGRSGGDNGTGYIRDPETNHAVSAPPKPFDEQIAQIQSKYGSKLKELNESYVNASLADIDTSNLKEQYAALVEESNAEFMQVIAENEK